MKKFLPIILISSLLLSGCSNIHEHKYSKANYQQPATCSVCGKVEGNVLTADYTKYNIQQNLFLNEEATYQTVCNDDSELVTTGAVTVLNDTVFDGDDTHPLKEGYQWHNVTIRLLFSDINSNEHGITYNYLAFDRYDITGYSNSYSYDAASNTNHFNVNYNGVDYPCSMMISTTSSNWKQGEDDSFSKTITISWDIQLPMGYDGMCVGLRDSRIDFSKYQYIYEYYNSESFLLYVLNSDYE